MKTVCQENMCTGCYACMDACSKKAITIVDKLEALNAFVDEDKCVNCGICESVCQNNVKAELQSPLQWYQGWARDEIVRRNSSSGGFATAIEKAFVRSGGKVCSCVFEDGKFTFRIVDNELEVERFTGSKYVKSNLSGVYEKIRAELMRGEKLLFVGLPCQVAALKLFLKNKYSDNLYTIDLICHGTPSSQILETFLNQYDESLGRLKDIKFRTKSEFLIGQKFKYIVTKGVWDSYTMAFLGTVPYTESCYNCHYATTKRISDITLGDSWGSNLDKTEIGKGISLALVQTSRGEELLKNSKLHLESVDIDCAVEHNHQLQHPARVPNGRSDFFKGIERGKNFNRLVFKIFPKTYIKQFLKFILIKMHFMRKEDKNSYGIAIRRR